MIVAVNCAPAVLSRLVATASASHDPTWVGKLAVAPADALEMILVVQNDSSRLRSPSPTLSRSDANQFGSESCRPNQRWVQTRED